jgi:hypothetical protein
MPYHRIKSLLALALDPSSPEGEWSSAAVKLIATLRKAHVTPEDMPLPKLQLKLSGASEAPKAPVGVVPGTWCWWKEKSR